MFSLLIKSKKTLERRRRKKKERKKNYRCRRYTTSSNVLTKNKRKKNLCMSQFFFSILSIDGKESRDILLLKEIDFKKNDRFKFNRLSFDE
jgi:hypothetical protein